MSQSNRNVLRRLRIAEQRPPARGRSRKRTLAQAGGGSLRHRHGLATRVHHRTQLIEAIGSSKPRRRQLPQGRRGLQLVQTAQSLQVRRERRTSFGQQCAQLLRFGRERLREHRLIDALGGERMMQPLGRLPQEEGDRRSGCRDHATRRTAFRRSPCRVRRNAAPANDSGETKVVEPARIVVGNPRRKQGALPLNRRSFETFELLDRRQHTFFAAELRLRSDVLKVEQPAQEYRRRDRLDLFAQRAQREPMNALQDAPLAPLDLVHRFVGRLRMFEDAAHRQPLHLHRQQGLQHARVVHAQQRCKVRCGRRPQQLQPALHHLHRGRITRTERL